MILEKESYELDTEYRDTISSNSLKLLELVKSSCLDRGWDLYQEGSHFLRIQSGLLKLANNETSLELIRTEFMTLGVLYECIFDNAVLYWMSNLGLGPMDTSITSMGYSVPLMSTESEDINLGYDFFILDKNHSRYCVDLTISEAPYVIAKKYKDGKRVMLLPKRRGQDIFQKRRALNKGVPYYEMLLRGYGEVTFKEFLRDTFFLNKTFIGDMKFLYKNNQRNKYFPKGVDIEMINDYEFLMYYLRSFLGELVN